MTRIEEKEVWQEGLLCSWNSWSYLTCGLIHLVMANLDCQLIVLYLVTIQPQLTRLKILIIMKTTVIKLFFFAAEKLGLPKFILTAAIDSYT